MTLKTVDPVLGETQTDARRKLDALFRRQAPALLRFLSRRTNPEEAQDLAQEAFLRLTHAAGKQALQKPEAYLGRIARNLLRDRAKSVSGRRERSHAVLEPEAHATSDGDPHLALEARQLLERHEAAVLKLKPKTREVYLRHRVDGQTYPQIAAALGIGVSAVEKHMMKAIAAVDRSLGRP
ncbi:RNA polymerase sigma factor [Caulobacter sp. CCNWLY153]|uniref:RNA polymerase sigma factor n=1 Tax=Caulobacter radicis TaxID=2172650 RepID=A0A2T9JIL0_9CAUL|nr:RNA polymerase sigma factor [Caulobacter radicis]PVM79400.1 RNA polymerase sigma factor [Caulobacter radicis]PVM83541.1 RNA polymerase sigma factor [Caulobacter radicis]